MNGDCSVRPSGNNATNSAKITRNFYLSCVVTISEIEGLRRVERQCGRGLDPKTMYRPGLRCSSLQHISINRCWCGEGCRDVDMFVNVLASTPLASSLHRCTPQGCPLRSSPVPGKRRMAPKAKRLPKAKAKAKAAGAAGRPRRARAAGPAEGIHAGAGLHVLGGAGGHALADFMGDAREPAAHEPDPAPGPDPPPPNPPPVDDRESQLRLIRAFRFGMMRVAAEMATNQVIASSVRIQEARRATLSLYMRLGDPVLADPSEPNAEFMAARAAVQALAAILDTINSQL
jgi:hypothetical protein